jgi:hypothetical protein
MNLWMERLDNMKKVIQYQKRWKYASKSQEEVVSRKVWVRRERWFTERSAWGLYRGKFAKHAVLSTFVRVETVQLQGQFGNLPPIDIFPKITYNKKPNSG